jgi:hypothetical protein
MEARAYNETFTLPAAEGEDSELMRLWMVIDTMQKAAGRHVEKPMECTSKFLFSVMSYLQEYLQMMSYQQVEKQIHRILNRRKLPLKSFFLV